MDWTKMLLGGLAAGPAPKPEYQHAGQLTSGFNQGLNTAQTRQAPQFNAGPQDQFRQGQMGQVQQLQGIASGQQKGAGELAAERQVQNALAAQMAQARMARGGNAGMANLAAARNSGAIGLSGVGMGQQAALQDQMNAQSLLTSALNAGRGQDLSLAGQNAQLTQQGQQMNDALYAQMLQQLGQMDANQLAAQFQAYQADKSSQGLLGPLLSAGGQIGAAALMPGVGG